MASNPYTVDIGNAGLFQDRRTPVQDNSSAIREREALRQKEFQFKKQLQATEAYTGAAMAFAQVAGGKIYEHFEEKAINQLLGSASSEAEAIEMFNRQAGEFTGAITDLTKLSKARQSGLSYTATQAEMRRILRETKNNNPLFSKALDEAARQYVTGTPKSGSITSGSLTSLSAAEQAEFEYTKSTYEYANKLGVSFDEAHARKRQATLQEDRKKHLSYLAEESGYTWGIMSQEKAIDIDALGNFWSDTITSVINEQGGAGLSKENQSVLKQQFQSQANQLKTAIRRDILERSKDPLFNPSPDDVNNLLAQVDSMLNNYNSLLEDTDLQSIYKDGVGIMKYNDLGYMMQHVDGVRTITALIGEGEGPFTHLVALNSSNGYRSMMESILGSDIVNDPSIMNNGGLAGIYLKHVENVTSDNSGGEKKDESIDVILGGASTTGDFSLITNNPTSDEGKNLTDTLVDSISRDSDRGTVLLGSKDSVIRAAKDSTYLNDVVVPSFNSAVTDISNRIIDEYGVGIQPGITIQFSGDDVNGYQVYSPDVSKDVNRRLRETYKSLQQYPAMLGLSQNASDKEKAEAAKKYMQTSMYKVTTKPEMTEATQQVIDGLLSVDPLEFDSLNVRKYAKDENVSLKNKVQVRRALRDVMDRIDSGEFTLPNRGGVSGDMVLKSYRTELEMAVDMLDDAMGKGSSGVNPTVGAPEPQSQAPQAPTNNTSTIVQQARAAGLTDEQIVERVQGTSGGYYTLEGDAIVLNVNAVTEGLRASGVDPSSLEDGVYQAENGVQFTISGGKVVR